ncbi:19107_t:CDS:1, partial [Cetraspora pellucida]
MASIIDETYSSKHDLYDALLNTLFPITFVILLNVKNEEKSIKNFFLPLLDDILYNMVTWAIPLIVSFTYGDTSDIMIFSIINMLLHVFCAVSAIVYAIITPRKKLHDRDFYGLYFSIVVFLILFPVIIIPVFWIIIISRQTFEPIDLVFLVLFVILLVVAVLA